MTKQDRYKQLIADVRQSYFARQGEQCAGPVKLRWCEYCKLEINLWTYWQNSLDAKIMLVGHESYNKVFHLNTVNSLHSRFKEMMRKFRGVATKYLNRYAALFSLIAMTVVSSVTEAADQLRRSLRTLRLPVTIESAKSLNILAI